MMKELIKRHIQQRELRSELYRGWVASPENTVAVEQNPEIAADPERTMAPVDNSSRVKVTAGVSQNARLRWKAHVDYSLSAPRSKGPLV